VLVTIFGDQRLKPEGFDEAAHWLGVRAFLEDNQAFREAPPGAVALWDRYMGYAAAMGLATRATQALPMGAEDDHRAWSAYGGHWREVRVSYPRRRLIWGRSPLGGMLVGLAVGLIGVGVAWLSWQLLEAGTEFGDRTAPWVELGSGIGLAFGLLTAALGLHTLWLCLLDLGSRVQREGLVVRRRSFKQGENEVLYFLALDDGSADRIKAWRVGRQMYDLVLQGEHVAALVSPRLGYVHALEVKAPKPLVSAR
jgi:hypothetical protein